MANLPFVIFKYFCYNQSRLEAALSLSGIENLSSRKFLYSIN